MNETPPITKRSKAKDVRTGQGLGSTIWNKCDLVIEDELFKIIF